MNIQTNIHELQKEFGAPFDNQKLKISGALNYLLECLNITYDFQRKGVVDPNKIVWIDNHYQDDHKKRVWSRMLAKERCVESSGNVSRHCDSLHSNPMYYFDGSMQKFDTKHPAYCHYQGKYYLANGSDGNHRTVLAKYLWHFNKEILTSQGYDGIKTIVYDIPKINIKMLALYKYLTKKCFCSSNKYLCYLRLEDNKLSIIICYNSTNKLVDHQKIKYVITDAEEFAAAMKLKYLFSDHQKQLRYWKMFEDIFQGQYKAKVYSKIKLISLVALNKCLPVLHIKHKKS